MIFFLARLFSLERQTVSEVMYYFLSFYYSACNGVTLLFFLTSICTYSIHGDTVSQFLVHLLAVTRHHQGGYMCMCSKYTGVYNT